MKLKKGKTPTWKDEQNNWDLIQNSVNQSNQENTIEETIIGNITHYISERDDKIRRQALGEAIGCAPEKRRTVYIGKQENLGIIFSHV